MRQDVCENAEQVFKLFHWADRDYESLAYPNRDSTYIRTAAQ